jgi:hypothetical protein
MKFWERFGIAIMSLWGLFALHQGVNALMKAHNWVGLDASAWASWVQAVGSIAAILGAYHLAQNQHRHDREIELAHRQQQTDDELDAQMKARLSVVRNLVHVAGHSLGTARTAVMLAENRGVTWELDSHLAKLDQLRTILDSLIAPTTENLAVISALEISEVLALTYADLHNLGGAAAEHLVERSKKRVSDGYEFLSKVVNLQFRLQEQCRSRGIKLEIVDVRPPP